DVLGAGGALITSTEAANGLVNKAVLRSWLTALANNAQITVTAEVNFGGGTNRADAVGFSSTNYTIKQRVFLDDYTPFTGNNLNGWVNYSNTGSDGYITSEAGNSFWRLIGKYTRQGGLTKTYGTQPPGTYEISFRYRASALPPAGQLQVYYLFYPDHQSRSITITALNVWHNSVQTIVMNGGWTHLILTYLGSQKDGGAYDFDDIRIRQISK
ncbi:hypothetical protein, partial [Pseudomonas sp. Marseille-Q1929]|uniref:hypothetical protein n=1 Tax=Pseudomonas sp. Marseille-Q1929 TaxID=2730402 RepID=UPI001A8FAA16